MRHAFLLISLIICLSCNSEKKEKKQAYFTDKQFKIAIKDALNDNGFVKLGEFKSHKVDSYIILSNHKITDTLNWENVRFDINPAEQTYDRTRLIKVHTGYPIENEAVVKLEYSPGVDHKVIETLNYAYRKGKWVLTKSGVAIQDGHFD